jgi:hypothetical protein
MSALQLKQLGWKQRDIGAALNMSDFAVRARRHRQRSTVKGTPDFGSDRHGNARNGIAPPLANGLFNCR